MTSFTVSTSKIVTAGLLTAGLCASTFAAPPAHAATGAPAASVTSIVEDLDLQAADVERGLALIESVPEAVLLQGQTAYEEWAAANPLVQRATRASILECTGAIALVIASTAFPVAKILKIKRLINSLGGVTKAVRIMWGASFSWEKIRALGGAAAALGAELLGIAAVKRGCFR